jgi:xanthine/uracil permease
LLISKVDFVIPAGKFGALFASIPFTVFAAVYCVLFGLVGVYHSSIISFSDGIYLLSSLLCSLQAAAVSAHDY